MMTMLRLISSESKVNYCEYLVGLFCAIAICVATYFLLMTAYFVVRRKKPSAKYGIELIFVIIAMLLSVGAKLAILPFLNKEAGGDVQGFGVVEYIGYSLSAIYSMIGGLQFEGLPFGTTSITNGIAACLYYGSSIISGLIVLSIITAKASYEIFSLVIIKFLKRRRDVYIFNCLTPDALLLAEDIADHHQKELAKYKENKDKNPNLKKPRKALILFAGNNIPAFSRNDPNCREVMSQSFYYYSMMKGKDTKKSLFSRLKLRRKNISLLSYQPTNLLNKESIDCLPSQNTNNSSNKKDKNERLRKKGNRTRIMELYFTLDENKKPMQEKNTFDAFSELDMIIDDLFHKRVAKVRAKKEYANRFKKWNTNNCGWDTERVKALICNFLYDIGLKSRWTITEQFILTQGETNYQFYSGQIDERVNKIVEDLLNRPIKTYFGSRMAKGILDSFGLKEKCLKDFTLKDLVKENKATYEEIFSRKTDFDPEKDGFESQFKNTLQKYVYALLQVNLVNESYLSSLSLIDERYKMLGASSIWAHLASVDDTKGDNEYKALVLGFGGNGQNALHALYYASPHLEDDGSSTGFYADVFDVNIEEIEGMFAKNHPLYRCYPTTRPNIDVNKAEITNIYKEFLAENNNNYELLCTKMQFPRIVFHRDSCTSGNFIRFFDEKTGREFTETGTGDKKNKEYNMIVIALGSDSTNIAVANTIIDDIKRELYLEFNDEQKTRNKRRQCIAVNIRDKNNLRKLNWNECDFKKGLFKNVVVFPFGSKEEIYTFDRIIDHSSMYEFNTNYSNMTQKIDDLEIDTSNDNTFEDRFKTTMKTLSKAFGVECDSRGDVKFDKLFFEIYQERNNADSGREKSIEYNLSYFKLPNFKKETNRISNVYSRIMRRAVKHFCINEKGEFALDIDSVRKLVGLEHERWNRFMISHGWVYAKKKDEVQKMHKSLLPMEKIGEKTFAYDIVNVIPEVYKIYNHCHILYKSLIKNSNTVDDVCAVLTHFLSYYKAINLISARYDIKKICEGEFPTIKITFDPNSAENNGNDQEQVQDAVLFSLHYDLHAHYGENNEKIDLPDNSVYVDDFSVPHRAFSVYGGADDLAGVACVLYGIVSALKEQKQNKVEIKRRIIVLISGGEERRMKGISKYLEGNEKNKLKKEVEECVVVDLNDRVGTYSTRGSRSEDVTLTSSVDLESELIAENISFEKTKKTYSESETRVTVKLRLSGKNEKDSIEKTKETLEKLSKKEIRTWFNLRTKQIIATKKPQNDSKNEKEKLIAKNIEEELIANTAKAIVDELIYPTDFSSGELDKWVQLSIPLALKDTLDGFNVDYDDSKTTVEITEITTKEKIKVKNKKPDKSGERIAEMSFKKDSGKPMEKSEVFIFNFSVWGEDEEAIKGKMNALYIELEKKHPDKKIDKKLNVSIHEFKTDEHSAPVERLKNAINAADVKSKSVTIEKSFCDANVIAHELGVPTVLLASGAMNAHQEGEYVYLDDLDKNVEIIKNYIVN